MASGIRFFACSGALGNTVSSLYANGMATIGLEIFNFEAGATASPNRMGFFGLGGAPNSAVIVGQYQDRTYCTDADGNDLGEMINCKFTGTSTVEHSGVPFTAGLENVPPESGTLLCRFTEPNDTPVVTQQATFRAINLTAASGAPDIGDLASNVTVRAVQLPDTDGFTGGTSWQEISDGGSALSLDDQSAEATVHDFHLLVSASPEVAGRKIDFAYYLQLEYL